MTTQLYWLLATSLILNGCAQYSEPKGTEINPIQTIAFGSCNKQDLDQSFWPLIQAQNPDLWIWLGDNIYADTEDMSLMADKYQQQKTNPFYHAFTQTVPVTGIWDDHDYGQNDGNRTYAYKAEAKQNFLDFLDISANDPVNQYPGIYRSETFGLPPQQIKIIHLDTRTFQDPLARTPKDSDKNYVSQQRGEILGAAQWQWLTQELNNSTAKVNIIASSIQVIAEDHRYEMWSNFPNQRKRLLDLIALSAAQNPLILSGDRHLSEISQINWHGKDLIDITSSGLTHSFSGNEEFNRLRYGNLITSESFSTLNFDWGKQSMTIQQILMNGEIMNELILSLK